MRIFFLLSLTHYCCDFRLQPTYLAVESFPPITISRCCECSDFHAVIGDSYQFLFMWVSCWLALFPLLLLLLLSNDEPPSRILTHVHGHRSMAWDSMTAGIYYTNHQTLRWLSYPTVKVQYLYLLSFVRHSDTLRLVG